LLISGVVQLVKFKTNIITKPVRFAFLSVILLFVPVPFFLLQSFVSIGDLTAASLLLAISTFLLPFGLAASGLLYIKNGMPKFYDKTDFLAVAFSLQWVNRSCFLGFNSVYFMGMNKFYTVFLAYFLSALACQRNLR
jgi:hypothetical protein